MFNVNIAHNDRYIFDALLAVAVAVGRGIK